MRLWHYKLISKLPRQQLLGQHRECCALLGKGWGKPHSVINYIYRYNLAKLKMYHYFVMEEMMERSYNVSGEWLDFNYRGKLLGYDNNLKYNNEDYIYQEHDETYYVECIYNLQNKGIKIL